MKTGRYKVREGWFGRAVMQAEYDSPSYIGGHVDAGIRCIEWKDCRFQDISHMVFSHPKHYPPNSL